MSRPELTPMLRAYAECALWSSTAEDGTPLDRDHTIDDIADETLQRMADDCDAFLHANEDDLQAIEPEQAGHDFWLSRNGHGTGFWDRGNGSLGQRLHRAAKTFGEAYLFAENGIVD